MLGESGWNAAGGALHVRKFARALLLRFLNAAFQIANGLEILIEFAAILRTEIALQSRYRDAKRIENAAVFPDPREARRAAGVVAVSEKALENSARVIFHGQRSRRIAPGEGIGVGAAIAGIAPADQLIRIEAQLERGELCLLAQFARGDLIHGDARADIRPFGFLGMNAGQEGRGRARVIAGAFARLGEGGRAPQAAENGDAVAKWLERPQDSRQFERRSFQRGRP